MGLGLFSVIGTCIRAIKEASEPVIPAENWGNEELMALDRKRGMTQDQIMQNIKQGRYIVTVQYPEPHRDKNGKIALSSIRLFLGKRKKDQQKHNETSG